MRIIIINIQPFLFSAQYRVQPNIRWVSPSPTLNVYLHLKLKFSARTSNDVSISSWEFLVFLLSSSLCCQFNEQFHSSFNVEISRKTRLFAFWHRQKVSKDQFGELWIFTPFSGTFETPQLSHRLMMFIFLRKISLLLRSSQMSTA